MKKIILVSSLVIFLLTASVFPAYADHFQFYFPDPSLDGAYVVACENTCRVFYPMFIPHSLYGSSTDNNTGSTFVINVPSDEFYAIAEVSQLNTILVSFYNYSQIDVPLLLVNYNQNGTVVSSNTTTINSGQHRTFTISDSNFPSGVYTGNIIRDDSFSMLPMASISFSNDLDYTSQIATIQAALSNIYNICVDIVDQDEDYYALVEQFLNDFFYDDNTDHGVVIDNWARMITILESMSSGIVNFGRNFNDWYHDYYNPKTDETNELLQDILDYLSQQMEDVTISDSMSGFHEMESAKDELQVTDKRTGQPVDAADLGEEIFSDTMDAFDDLGSNVGAVGTLITNIITSNSIVMIPLIVGLALGLAVTILGKNKSD